MKKLWSIAGHDPNAAAGFQADLLLADVLGIKARSLMATFTAQSDHEVFMSEAVPLSWLKAQWQVLRKQEIPDAIKLGLISSPEHLSFLAEAFRECPNIPVIADPVLASSSGHSFASPESLSAWRKLAPSLSLLTPNRPETERLLGHKLTDQESIIQAARELRSWGLRAVLIKGGHSEADSAPLDYFDDGQRAFWLQGRRSPRDFRGTGCSLATAIVAHMAKGHSLREAVVLAHGLLQETIHTSCEQGEAYLRFQKGPTPLSQLSYETPRQHPSFPRIDDGPIGFYPIVPNLEWLVRLGNLGVRSLQLRIKDLRQHELVQSIEAAVEFCRPRGIRLFINDYWKLAAAAGAYGVHLGQEDLDALSTTELTRLQDSGLRLGISTHCYEEAARSLSLRPSYIALGPIFPTRCKSMAFGPQGLGRVEEWVAICSGIPVVAIGGLNLEHAKELLESGVDGISLISDVLEAFDPDLRTRQWLAAVQ